MAFRLRESQSCHKFCQRETSLSIDIAAGHETFSFRFDNPLAHEKLD
jgi:hypothetical protein